MLSGRQQRLEVLAAESRTLIFYESPYRLQQTLEDFATIFSPSRQIVLARELTKLHEQFWRGTIEDAIATTKHKQLKG